MTVDRIIPCVCIPHPPTVADSVMYGMPRLCVTNGLDEHKQFWSAYCPVCGRGDKCAEFSSSYKALKNWNTVMACCYEMEHKEIIFDDDFEKYVDSNGNTREEYRSKWDELN